jgi:hypothetical protein
MNANMTDISNSSSLYQTPSLLKGAARIVSISGTLDEYRISPTKEEADTKALHKDWEMVGEDMTNAIQQYDSIE